MAYLRVKERVLEMKIVYYGAGLSGKTTNLEQVKKHAAPGRTGELISLNTDGDRTLFFDWLPFDMGKINGCEVKVQLFTVPGQAKYAETRKRVLAGADGVVLVLDSQSGALDRNRQTLADLHEHISANGLATTVPIVVQLNKRDLSTAMAPEELLSAVGMPGSAYIEAVASSGRGVFETLREVARQVFDSVRTSARSQSSAIQIKSGDDAGGLDGDTLLKKLTAELPEEAAPSRPHEQKQGPEPAPEKPAANAEARPATGLDPAPVDGPKTGRVPVAASPPAAPSSGAAAAGHAVTPPPPRAAPPAGSNSVEVSAAEVLPSGGLRASAAQLNEVIVGQRTLLRRLDSIERAVLDLERRPQLSAAETSYASETIERGIAELQQRFGAVEERLRRLDEVTGGAAAGVERAAAAALSTGALVERAHRELSAQNKDIEAGTAGAASAITEVAALVSQALTKVDQTFGWLGERLTGLEKADGERLRTLASTLTDAMKITVKSANSSLENGMTAALAGVEKRVDDVRAMQRKLASDEQALGSSLSLAQEELKSRLASFEVELMKQKNAQAEALTAQQARSEAAMGRHGESLRDLRALIEHLSADGIEKSKAQLAAIEGWFLPLAATVTHVDGMTAKTVASLEAIYEWATELDKLSRQQLDIEKNMSTQIEQVDSSLKDVWGDVHGQFKVFDSRLGQVSLQVFELLTDWKTSKKSWWRS